MKLSHKIDLDAMRQLAFTAIDSHYSRVSARVAPVVILHQAKLAAAQSLSSALVAEAAHRGMTVEALASLILRKNGEQQHALMQIDAKRIAAKAGAAAATSGQELTAIIQSHQ